MMDSSVAAQETELTVDWTSEELVRGKLAEVAGYFVDRATGRINLNLIAVVRIPGRMREQAVGHILQQAIVLWIRKNAHRSGISDDVFFLTLEGVPVRLRVDISRGPVSPILTFRAISR